MKRHRIAMLGMALIVAVAAASMLPPLTAQAGPQSYDGQITLAAGDTCVTQTIPFASEAWTLDRIVFYGDGTVTSAVHVTAEDYGVFTELDTFAVSAGGGSSQRPPGFASVSYATQYVVTGEVALAKSVVTTNYVPVNARTLRAIYYKPSGASAVTLHHRIYGVN